MLQFCRGVRGKSSFILLPPPAPLAFRGSGHQGALHCPLPRKPDITSCQCSSMASVAKLASAVLYCALLSLHAAEVAAVRVAPFGASGMVRIASIASIPVAQRLYQSVAPSVAPWNRHQLAALSTTCSGVGGTSACNSNQSLCGGTGSCCFPTGQCQSSTNNECARRGN